MGWTACHGGATFSGTNELASGCASALRKGKDALSTITCLELDGGFNAGCGSSLNLDGQVECEAGVMYSGGRFGGVASVSTISTPSSLATAIANNRASLPGLVAPNFLVGAEALKYAKLAGIMLCSPDQLISRRSLQSWTKAKKLLSDSESIQITTSTEPLDTVGAVEINDTGECIACSSSGGIILKSPGRVGQSPIWGAGVWAEQRNDSRVAIAVTGLGEAIVRCSMARSIADSLFNASTDEVPVDVVSRWLNENFVDHKWMSVFPKNRLIAGGIILLQRFNDSPELVIFNNSPFLPVAYTNSNGKTKALMTKGNDDQAFHFTSLLL